MRDNSVIAHHIVNIFRNNFETDFIFDSLEQRALSYRDFFIYILNGKDILGEIDKDKSGKIAIIVKNSLELLILYFAALIKGIAIIPIDTFKGDLDITEILSEAQCNIIICDNRKRLNNIISDVNIISLDSIRNDLYLERKSSDKELGVFHSIDFDKPYTITFTSGTTGKPKGVMHSFSNFFMSALSFRKCFNFNNENIFYHNLPMTYMAGILNLIFLPFLSESKIVIGERFDASIAFSFWETPVKYRVNTFFFVPFIISFLLKFDRGTMGVEYAKKTSITACVGTAPLNKQVQYDFENKYGVKLYESYGLSETLFVTTNSPLSCGLRRGVGGSLDGVKLDFYDDGEILIDVPWRFLGYYNVETSQYLDKGKFISGDIGELDNDNMLTIIGRKKDLIIKGGVNISPQKLVDVILKLKLFEECTVIGIEDPTLGEKTVCCYTLGDKAFSLEMKKALNRHILEHLGRDYLIDEFLQMTELPKNINGKIDKSKIKQIYAAK
jgi:long-chain acyl-CoA synthetase